MDSHPQCPPVHRCDACGWLTLPVPAADASEGAGRAAPAATVRASCAPCGQRPFAPPPPVAAALQAWKALDAWRCST